MGWPIVAFGTVWLSATTVESGPLGWRTQMPTAVRTPSSTKTR